MNIQEIYKAASKAGACKEKGLELISRANCVEDLIELMKSPQGVEFCMANAFPSKELLLKYEAQLLKENIIVEGVHNLTNPSKVIIFGGSVTIDVNGFNVCEVYATNDAVVTIIADGYSFTTVELHGDSRAFGGSNKNAIVRAFNHKNKVDV